MHCKPTLHKTATFDYKNMLNRNIIMYNLQIMHSYSYTEINCAGPSRNFNKKAQLSLTNPRDACEKFARFT